MYPTFELRPGQIRAERWRGIWLGITAGILCLIGMLNILPSHPVLYMHEARLFASPPRVEKLRQLAQVDSQSKSDSPSQSRRKRDLVITEVQTMKVNAPKAMLQVSNADNEARMETVRVVCFSAQRKDPKQIQALLQRESQPDRIVVADSEDAKKLRWARWRLETSQRSLSQISDELNIVSNRPRVSSKNSLASAATQNTESPFQVASTILPADASEGEPEIDQKVAELRRIKTELQTSVDRESSSIAQLEQAVLKLQAASRGFLTLSSDPKMQPQSQPIKTYYSLAAMLVAVLAGVFFARSYWKSVIPASIELKELPRRLENLGIKYLGEMSSLTRAQPRTNRGLMPRTLHLWLARGVDALFVACVVLIVMRATQDSQWRIFLTNNPLSALSHLISGLT